MYVIYVPDQCSAHILEVLQLHPSPGFQMVDVDSQSEVNMKCSDNNWPYTSTGTLIAHVQSDNWTSCTLYVEASLKNLEAKTDTQM